MAEIEELRARLAALVPPLLSTQRSSWEQGIAAQAFLEVHRLHDMAIDNSFELIYGIVHDAIVRQATDGRLAVRLNGNGSSDTGALDPACIGESVYFIIRAIRDHEDEEENAKFFADGVERMLVYILDYCPKAFLQSSSSSDQLLSHRIDKKQIWSDAVYMLPPFLASSAVYYAQSPNPRFDPKRLLRQALQQIILSAEALQSPTGEWSHIYDLEKGEFERQAFWGVGNGWVCAGIVRTLRVLVARLEEQAQDDPIAEALSKDAEIRNAIQKCYGILLRTLLALFQHMQLDGLFYNVLGDTKSFLETNLSQQLSYTLYRLLDLHLMTSPRVKTLLQLQRIDKSLIGRWSTLAETMRKAAIAKTDKKGFVRDVCGSPTFDRPGTAAEGQAWGILMEVACAEYKIHKRFMG